MKILQQLLKEKKYYNFYIDENKSFFWELISKQMNKNILITGGAGFIGSAVVRQIIKDTDHNVMNIDVLSYAANLNSLGFLSFTLIHFI